MGMSPALVRAVTEGDKEDQRAPERARTGGCLPFAPPCKINGIVASFVIAEKKLSYPVVSNDERTAGVTMSNVRLACGGETSQRRTGDMNQGKRRTFCPVDTPD